MNENQPDRDFYSDGSENEDDDFSPDEIHHTRDESRLPKRTSTICFSKTASQYSGMKTSDIVASILECPDPNPEMKSSMVSGEFSFDDLVKSLEAQECSESISVEGEQSLPDDFVPPDNYPVQLKNARAQFASSEYYPKKFMLANHLRVFQPHEQLLHVQHVPQIQAEYVKVISLNDLSSTMSTRQLRQLFGQLNNFTNCERLFLRNCALERVDHFNFPRLQTCDLSSNNIKKTRTLASMMANSRYLIELNIAMNPITMSTKWNDPLPNANSDGWKLVAMLPWLATLNSVRVEHKHRVHALQKHATTIDRQLWSLRCFDSVLAHRVPSLQAMARWNPNGIRHLNLSQSGLDHVQLSAFKAVETVDLSHNVLTTIVGCGLEKLDKLVALNLSNNQIANKEDLAVFQFIPSLQSLDLSDNPVQEHWKEVVHFTRFLRGNDETGGLQKLNGAPITLEMRLEAIGSVKNVSGSSEEIQFTKSSLLLEHHLTKKRMLYGLDRIRSITLVKQGITMINLSGFVGVQLLDLQDNKLRDVIGLENLNQLRVLNLGGNDKLNMNSIVANIKRSGCTSLRSISLLPRKTGVSPKHFMWVLSTLFNNGRLRFIDSKPVEPKDWISAFQKATHANSKQTEEYRINLALYISVVKSAERCHIPSIVNSDTVYDPLEVKELLRLADMRLNSKSLDLGIFINLERINLSNNLLTSLNEAGLGSLGHIRELDVSNNKIKDDPLTIAKFIDSHPALEVIAVRGNPGMTKGSFQKCRVKLLGACERMREIHCTLQIVDTPVTVSERIDAWKKAGGSEEECEQLRADIAMYKSLPANVPGNPEMASTVTTLCLDFSMLQRVDLTAFTGLVKLRLRGNDLTTLDGIGIERMKHLRILDLRENRLNMKNKGILQSITDVTGALPKLLYVGLSGNDHSRKPMMLNKDEDDEAIAMNLNMFDAKTAQRHRGHIIRQMPQLLDPNCKLRYLDEDELGIDEICDCLKKPADEVETFRFNLVLHRALDEQDSPSIEELDLSNKNLRRFDANFTPNVRKLSLRGNHMNAEAVMRSGILELQHLEELDLAENQIDRMNVLRNLLNGIPTLKNIYVDGNPCFKTNTINNKLKLLALLDGTGRRKFGLERINDDEITIKDRCAALERFGNVPLLELEKLRFTLTLEKLGTTGDESFVDLSGQQLQVIQLARINKMQDGEKVKAFQELTVLHARNNCLVTLAGQSLPDLACLEELDVRDNEIVSLEALVQELKPCHNLKRLHLQNACASAQTNKPDQYINYVCEHLPSVEEVDDVANPFALSAEEQDAAAFLRQIGGIGPNQLREIDLSNQMQLDPKAFFWILAALSHVPVKILKMSGCGWDIGVGPQGAHYRRYVVAALGEKLQELDGSVVDDDERAAALRFVADEEKNWGKQLKRQRWSKLQAQAIVIGSGVVASAIATQAVDRQAQANMNTQAASGATNSNEADRAGQQAGGDGVDSGGVAGGDGADGGVTGDGAAGARSSGAPTNGDSTGSNEVTADTGAAAAQPLRLRPVVKKSVGSVWNKLEMLISFLQIYGMVLSLEFYNDVPWPDGWKPINKLYETLSHFVLVDIDIAFSKVNVDIPPAYEGYVQFGITMLIPAILLMCFFLAHAMDRDKWIVRYYVQWNKTKLKLFFTWLFFMIVGFGIGLLSDHPNAFDEVKEGKQPTGASNTVIAGCWSVVTFIAIVYLAFALIFRKKYIIDKKADPPQLGGDKFLQFWGTLKRMVQRLVLFLITVAYLPITRVILDNFAGHYNVEDLNDSGCVYRDSSGYRCCLRRFQTHPCMSSPQRGGLTIVQVLSATFLVLYTVGIPVFFANLIRTGVGQVDRAGFATQSRMLDLYFKQHKIEEKALKAKKKKTKEDKRRTKQKKQDIKHNRQQKRNLYVQLMEENPKAQMYLYMPYQRRHRYYKILQMAEKLALVCISLYVPYAEDSAKLIASDVMLGLVTIFTFLSMPFNDSFEDCIELAARFANTVNIFALMSAKEDWLNEHTLFTFLIIANGLAVCIFVFAIVSTPIRKFIYKRKFKKQRAERLKQLKEQEINEGDDDDGNVETKNPVGQEQEITTTTVVRPITAETQNIPELSIEGIDVTQIEMTARSIPPDGELHIQTMDHTQNPINHQQQISLAGTESGLNVDGYVPDYQEDQEYQQYNEQQEQYEQYEAYQGQQQQQQYEQQDQYEQYEGQEESKHNEPRPVMVFSGPLIDPQPSASKRQLIATSHQHNGDDEDEWAPYNPNGQQ